MCRRCPLAALRLLRSALTCRDAEDARDRRIPGQGEDHRRLPGAWIHGRIQRRPHPRPARARLRDPEGAARQVRHARRGDRRGLRAVLRRRPRQEADRRGVEAQAQGGGRAPAGDGRGPRRRGDRVAPAPGAAAEGARAPHGLPRDHPPGDRARPGRHPRGGQTPRRLAGDTPHPRPPLRLRGLARALEEGHAAALCGPRAVGGDAARRRPRAGAKALRVGLLLGSRRQLRSGGLPRPTRPAGREEGRPGPRLRPRRAAEVGRRPTRRTGARGLAEGLAAATSPSGRWTRSRTRAARPRRS